MKRNLLFSSNFVRASFFAGLLLTSANVARANKLSSSPTSIEKKEGLAAEKKADKNLEKNADQGSVEISAAIKQLERSIEHLSQTIAKETKGNANNLSIETQKRMNSQLDELKGQLEVLRRSFDSNSKALGERVRIDLGDVIKNVGNSLRDFGERLKEPSARPTSTPAPFFE